MASNSESTSDEAPFSGEVEEIMEVVDPENSDMEEEEEEGGGERRVFLPGDSLDEGEMLVRDDSAYHMYHQAQTGKVCVRVPRLRTIFFFTSIFFIILF